MALIKVATAGDIPAGEANTGKPRTLPATMPVRAYPVKMEGDDILIEVDE